MIQSASPLATMLCPLCECEIADSSHHLIPRMVWKGQKADSAFKRRFGMTKAEIRRLTVSICRDCHDNINELISERQQAKHCTIELLRSHPKFAKYLQFKRKRFGVVSEGNQSQQIPDGLECSNTGTL